MSISTIESGIEQSVEPTNKSNTQTIHHWCTKLWIVLTKQNPAQSWLIQSLWILSILGYSQASKYCFCIKQRFVFIKWRRTMLPNLGRIKDGNSIYKDYPNFIDKACLTKLEKAFVQFERTSTLGKKIWVNRGGK